MNLTATAPFVIGLLLLLPQRRAAGHLPPYERRAVRWRQSAITLGLVAAALLECLPIAHIHGDLLAAPVFGVIVLAGVLTGELLAPRPAGTVRSATLVTRRARHYLPPGHRAVPAALLTGLAGLLSMIAVAITSYTADGDGYSQITCGGTVNLLPSAWTVTSEIAATVLILLGSAAMCLPVLRKIVNRPPATMVPEGEARDADMRAVSAGTLFYAWSCLPAASLFTWALTAQVLFGDLVGGCTGWWLTPLQVTAYVATAMGGTSFVYLLTQLIKHSSRRATV